MYTAYKLYPHSIHVYSIDIHTAYNGHVYSIYILYIYRAYMYTAYTQHIRPHKIDSQFLIFNEDAVFIILFS